MPISTETEQLNNGPSKKDFNFPYPPYDIQLKLMNVAYDVYEDSKFALLESPTGTGKSLSIICSSLTWLSDFQKRRREDLDKNKETLTKKIEDLKREEDSSGDWIGVQTKRQEADRLLVEVNKHLEKLNRIDSKDEARRSAVIHNETIDSVYSSNIKKVKKPTVEDSVLLGTYLDDEEEEDDVNIEQQIKEQEVDEVQPKIYYASRTHSQLSQFVREVKKTKFANINDGRPIKVVPLASRHILCVNPDVVALKEPSAINERCSELQREKNAAKRCPYARLKQINKLKEDVLSSVQDIEDIVSRGQAMGSCPYFANRMAVAEAELVVLPYNNLLHHETRKASSLNLTDSVIILDEAHNILETICSIHSSPITGSQLIRAHMILSNYCRKYHKRMKPKNVEMIKMIVECLTAIIRFLDNSTAYMAIHDGPVGHDTEKESVNPMHKELIVDVAKFIGAAKIGGYNLFMILEYLNRVQLARKLIGLDATVDLTTELCDLTLQEKPLGGEKTNLLFLNEKNSNITKDLAKSSAYPIYMMIEFLKSLTSVLQDGKIFVDHHKGNIASSTLKFILLNPASHFQEMTRQARSFVLAGGTMQPFSEFVDLLLKPVNIDEKRLVTFSCGHVIKPSQIYFATLSQGPSAKPLELNYKTRTSMETIDEFGKTIMNLTIVCPAGMVCFFPSYDYEQMCFNRWNFKGFIATIESKSKEVFREPREPNKLKQVLDDYAMAIENSRKSGRGALLMCIVGGKMSEGINFNDDLGRCVVMIGLPFANIKSGELKQKMSFYDRTCKPDPNTNRSAGQQYYENLCIKGINQSIGRAVRHKNDYAAIVLLDIRFSSKTNIRNGLPSWMMPSLVDCDQFGILLRNLKLFFQKIKLETNQEVDI